MSFFHLRTVPGYNWPPLPDSIISQVWNAYLELDRTQWLTPAELEQNQLRQVRSLLTHCIAHVPYYRQVLPDAGIDPQAIQSMDDFRRIPLLPRRVYQEKHASFVATHLPAGTTAGKTSQTSGSSGSPTYVYGTNMTSLWWHATFLLDLEWCNFDPTGTFAALRHTSTTGPELERMLQGITMPCWSPALDPLIETGTAYGMDLRRDPREQLRWLRRIAPNYLLSLSSNLEALAHLVRREGPIPSLRGIQSIASTLTAESQVMIESAFGVPVKNIYSCFEAGHLAAPCPQGHGLHVHAENVILELLDEDDRPCKPGQTGRVFLTHLQNLRGPFIRYELGDEATWAEAACPCGRGLPLLSGVQGKNYPMFHLPSGRLKSCASLGQMLRMMGGHWQHQAIQKTPDHVVVRFAVDPTWTEANIEKTKQIVREFFEGPMTVDLEIHEHLTLPTSGKFQSMINEIA